LGEGSAGWRSSTSIAWHDRPRSARVLPGEEEEHGHQADEDGGKQARADNVPGLWFHARPPLLASIEVYAAWGVGRAGRSLGAGWPDGRMRSVAAPANSCTGRDRTPPPPVATGSCASVDRALTRRSTRSVAGMEPAAARPFRRHGRGRCFATSNFSFPDGASPVENLVEAGWNAPAEPRGTPAAASVAGRRIDQPRARTSSRNLISRGSIASAGVNPKTWP